MSRRHLPDRTVAEKDGAVLAPDDARRQQSPARGDARRQHYAEFYGDEPVAGGFGVVIGNCQAESLRIVLDSPAHPTVRVPAVHELTAADTRRLHELLPRAGFLVSQPIRDDYHALPLGTRQLRAALPPAARTVVVPSVRFGGLHPFQAAIRVAGLGEDPPLVAYHDVRVLAEAAGLPLPRRVSSAAVRAIADDTLASLRQREEGADLRASDLFDRPDFPLMRTINHPGNAMFLPLAERILHALGSTATPTDPGRPILAAVQAPREEWVAEIWGSSEATSADWLVDGASLSSARVAEAHRDWYARHPAFVTAAITRLAPLVARWRAA